MSDPKTRKCPKCERWTMVGYKVWQCLCCGHSVDLRRKKGART